MAQNQAMLNFDEAFGKCPKASSILEHEAPAEL